MQIVLKFADSRYVTPELSYVSTGANLTLTCNHPSYPAASVRWIQGGPESLSDPALGDARLTPSGSQLFIQSFQAIELAGQYSCVVDPPSPPATELVQSIVSCPGHVEHARECVCVCVLTPCARGARTQHVVCSLYSSWCFLYPPSPRCLGA